jgi:hypothetical protein
LFLSEPPWVTEIGLLPYLRKSQQLNDKPSDRLSLPISRHPRLNTDKMPGVGVKDIESHKFVSAYAAFLKRQGKLPM